MSRAVSTLCDAGIRDLSDEVSSIDAFSDDSDARNAGL